MCLSVCLADERALHSRDLVHAGSPTVLLNHPLHALRTPRAGAKALLYSAMSMMELQQSLQSTILVLGEKLESSNRLSEILQTTNRKESIALVGVIISACHENAGRSVTLYKFSSSSHAHKKLHGSINNRLFIRWTT
uniref:Uncharacterized protein n=1 Tax=Trichogramma kaykai TaxID=54128 RepID=A0ABD2X7F1_9HYME